MLRKLSLGLAVLALSITGCSMPAWTPDTTPLMSQAGPVATPGGVPVTCRDWNCKCHCVKGCYQ